MTHFVLILVTDHKSVICLLVHGWKMLEIALDFWFLNCTANETFYVKTRIFVIE